MQSAPFPSSRLAALSDDEIVALAQSAAPDVRQPAYLPGWRFLIEEAVPDEALAMRLALWRECRERRIAMPVEMPWLDGLKLGLVLGNDLSRSVFVCGSYEPNEFAFLAECLEPGMTMVDVGANEGLYALFGSQRVGPEGRVLAFEPSGREMRRLIANVARNALTNLSVFPVGLSDREGQAMLRIAEDEHAGHNTLGDFAYPITEAGQERVTLKPLDAVLAEERVGRLDFVKLDVEGAELAVLQGARESLRRFRPIVQFELVEEALRPQGASGAALQGFLSGLGYRTYAFSMQTGRPVALDGPPPDGTNLIAIAEDREVSGTVWRR